ncbi:MAG TPA: hypothetical protein VES65_09790, partial [Solirubrobacteraceae bacterium]|nr:hypothetical protein [Solirubrobacteraceae bacterium]
AGAVTRTKVQTYDTAGRALTSEETSSPATDTALPKVTNTYNEETGALEKQSATISGETKTLTDKQDTRGQQSEYADGQGNVTKDVYEEGGDRRLVEMSEGKGEEAKSSQTYSYDPTTGLMTTLVDSAAGTFKATYDVEGKMQTEVYPNGMTASSTYDPAGTATALEYVKTTHCTEENGKCKWFTNSIVPSIHGETLAETSTLAKEKYTYDNAGRLTEAQETPTGEHCKTRLYGYDEESNRLSQTTREASTETCPTEGGTVQNHSYDTANRLTDGGVEYEKFGNTTKLPPADAGEHELVTKYYVDNQVESQTQQEKTIGYTYDPAGRAMETVTKEGATKSTVISHYADPGKALTWTSEGAEKWTRNIPGIDGALDAIQTNGGTPILQVHDLEGNIVGTAALSETESKLLSTYNSTEFGVPTTSSPPKYSWLGASGVASELSSGVSTQGGASYVPQIARDLQTAPIEPPGAFPNGSGAGERYVAEIPGWSTSLANAESAATIAEYLAKQEALKREQEEALVQCIEGKACVEDDSHVAFYTNRAASEMMSGYLSMVSSFDSFLEALKTISAKIPTAGGALSIILGGIKALITVGSYVLDHILNTKNVAAYAQAWAHNLDRCTNAISIGNGRHGEVNPTCRSEVFYGKVLGTIPWPDFGEPVDVSFCKVGSTNCVLKGG